MKNNAKRILSFMLAVVLCAGMLVLPVSAEDHEYHHHCTETGCECELEHVPANGTEVKKVDPKCATPGYTIYACTGCGHNFVGSLVTPENTAHVPGETPVAPAVDAICGVPGVEATYECTVPGCGAKCDANGDVVIDVIKPEFDKHDFEESAPVNGKVTLTCKNCGYVTEKTVACEDDKHTYPARPNVFVPAVKNEDGTITKGYATYICTNTTCKHEKTVDVLYTEVPAEPEHVCGKDTCKKVAAVTGTCLVPGNVEHYICECGKYYLIDAEGVMTETTAEDVVVAGEHAITEDATTSKEPTCTEWGVKAWICTVCGQGVKAEGVPPTHKWEPTVGGKIASEPTCTIPGYTGDFTCSACGETTVGEEIPATGHNIVKGEKAPTCAQPGFTYYYCTNNCDVPAIEVLTIGTSSYNVTVDGKAVHLLTGKFTVDGKEVDCKFEILPGNLDANNHNYYGTDIRVIDGVKYLGVYYKATCTSEEMFVIACQDCNFEQKFILGNKLECNFDLAYDAKTGKLVGKSAYTIVTDTSLKDCQYAKDVIVFCANEGCMAGKDGAVNSKVVLDMIPAAKHNFVEYREEPTCQDEIGLSVNVCTVCGENEKGSEKVLNFTEPDFYDTLADAQAAHAGKLDLTSKTAFREGTCLVVALSEYTCEGCGRAVHVREGEEFGLGHKIGTFEEGKAAYEAAFPGSAHVWTAASEAACGVAGYTGDFYCTQCGAFIIGREIPAIEHNKDTLVLTEKVDATCTTNGCEAYYTCKECKKTFADVEGKTEVDVATLVIIATGHKWTVTDGIAVCDNCGATCNHKAEGVVVVTDATFEKATCTEYGFLYHTCECGYEWIDNYAKETGHTSDEGVTTDAQCATDGKTVYSCTVCGEVIKTEVIPATGHTNAAGEKFGLTCTDGVKDRVCVDPKCTHKDFTLTEVVDVEIPLEHDDIIVSYIEATCKDFGYTLTFCTACHWDKTEIVDYTTRDHNFTGKEEIVKDPTPAVPGEKKVYCAYGCGEFVIVPVEYTGTSFDVTVENTLAAKVEADKAAGNLSEDLVIDKKVVNGSEIKVTITLNTEAIELWGLELDIRYATQYLTFKGAEVGEVFADTAVFGTTVVDNGNGWLALLATANNSADPEHGGVQNQTVEGAVVVVELYFDVTDKAAGKNVEITFDAAAYDKDAKVVATQTGAATIEVATLYDVTHDGAINMADLNAMMKMYTGESNVYCTAADINRNGVIDVEDIQAMMLYVLKN